VYFLSGNHDGNDKKFMVNLKVYSQDPEKQDQETTLLLEWVGENYQLDSYFEKIYETLKSFYESPENRDYSEIFLTTDCLITNEGLKVQVPYEIPLADATDCFFSSKNCQKASGNDKQTGFPACKNCLNSSKSIIFHESDPLTKEIEKIQYYNPFKRFVHGSQPYNHFAAYVEVYEQYSSDSLAKSIATLKKLKKSHFKQVFIHVFTDQDTLEPMLVFFDKKYSLTPATCIQNRVLYASGLSIAAEDEKILNLKIVKISTQTNNIELAYTLQFQSLNYFQQFQSVFSKTVSSISSH